MNKRKRKNHISFKLNDITAGQLSELSRMTGLSKASIVTLAVRKLYQSEVHKTAVQQERRSNGAGDTPV